MNEKKLKILQVVPYFYPAWAYGGVPRIAYELSKELVRRGHDVTVYTTDVFDRNSRHEVAGGQAVVDGIKVHYFKNISNLLAYDYQIFLPIGLMTAIRSTIKGFDIIHLHSHRNFLNNIARHYATRFNKPYLLSGHGTVLRIERRFLAKALFDLFFGRQILRDAARLIAVSESEVKQYKEMGVSENRVEVIYNALDPASYKRLPKKGLFKRKHNLKGKSIVLYLGKITPRKGIDFLIKAFSLLKRPDTVLVIAGNDMGFKNQLLKIISEKGLTDSIVFTGLVVGEEKLAAYRDADVLVYPSIHEIFGLVPFEAMMCATPVIVTDDCGCGDIIAREKIGMTVKYNDITGLRDVIEKTLSDRVKSLEAAKRGKIYIEERLNWSIIGQRYLDAYRKLLV